MKEYQCPTCGKNFKLVANFEKHLVTHLEDIQLRLFKAWPSGH